MTPDDPNAWFADRDLAPPRKTNLLPRIRKFFVDNPDEELTLPMLREKFGVSANAIAEALKRLKKEGQIESVHVVRLRAKGIAR